MEIKINLNAQIRVKLTPKGYDVLKKNFEETFLYTRADMAKEAYDRKVASVVDGFMTFQLWDFMNIFGPKLYLGSINLIEENNIYISESEV